MYGKESVPGEMKEPNLSVLEELRDMLDRKLAQDKFGKKPALAEAPAEELPGEEVAEGGVEKLPSLGDEESGEELSPEMIAELEKLLKKA